MIRAFPANRLRRTRAAAWSRPLHRETVLTPADLVNEPGRPLTLSAEGKARAFVLAKVDDLRSGDDITATVLAEWPDMLPTQQAVREFVKKVLAHHCQI